MFCVYVERQWQHEDDVLLQDAKAFTYQGLQGCIRPVDQRGQVVRSLRNRLVSGLGMWLLLPSPALPEGPLGTVSIEVRGD